MIESYKKEFHAHVRKLQDQITQALFEVDSSLKLNEDLWERTDYDGKPGGGGVTRVFTGDIIENAGVNTSLIFGSIDEQFLSKLGAKNNSLWAAGISLIIHPRNPRVPTVHANFRLIHVPGEKYWFGGGADLTPFYPYPEDFRYFHQIWKKALSPFGHYDWMKKECDEYFVNHHRGSEMRGIGGIFFDYYNKGDLEKDFSMVKSISEAFISSYFPIVEKRKNESWTEEDEDFQLHRRGRYVEFNLLHDRGTLFGLKSKGRVDSIFVSLPARCKFSYQYAPKEMSPHAEMQKYYFPHSWAEEKH